MAGMLTAALAVTSMTGISADAAKKPVLSRKSVRLKEGQRATVSIKNSHKKAKVTWKSSRTSVAKLSAVKKTSVKVIARKKGKAKVTASFKNGAKKVKLTCKITVRAKKAVTPVVSNPTNRYN